MTVLRLLFILCSLLVVGLLLNVLVAWSCFLTQPVPLTRSVAPESAPRLHDWPVPVPDGWPAQAELAESAQRRGVGISSYVALPGVDGPDTRLNSDRVLVGIDVVRAGWPWLALEKESWAPTIERYRPPKEWNVTGLWRGGLRVPSWVPRRPGIEKHSLPVRPSWAGFAGGAAFYAAVLALLLAVPLAFRALRRRHRGLCVRCGYDLRGLTTCPECGRAGPPFRRATA
ncbi:MAG: hypothetical protein JNM07_07885 [Phycisphaerae bacterium]|nr:hypothetical protein [Phycisphaerae bacterium]